MAKWQIMHVYGTLLIAFLTIFDALLLASADLVWVQPRNISSGISDGYRCTDSARWRGSGSSKQDCNEAVKLLYDVEVIYFGAKNYDFLSPNARPRGQDYMRTPRKYAVGESYF